MNQESYSFRLINQGREGQILYQESDQVLVLDWEYGPESICLFIAGIRRWKSPEGTPVPLPKQLEILDRLRTWLIENNIKSTIDLPENTNLSDNVCAWAGCENSQLGDLKICLHHFNLACLGVDST